MARLSKRKHFSFVANLEAIPDGGPIPIIPGYFLEKATDAQLEHIRPIILRFGSIESGPHRFLPSPYEHKKFVTGHRSQMRKLKRDYFRYYVITYNGSSINERRLSTAMLLYEKPIFVPFRIHGQFGFQWDQEILLQTLRGIGDEWSESGVPFVSVSQTDLGKIRSIYKLIQHMEKSDHKFEIRQVINSFRLSLGLPMNNPMVILSLVAVIESILTHQPKPNDPTESITRQVSCKMNLLSHQFDFNNMTMTHFKAVIDTVKLWKAIYEYRSRVAHGDRIFFTNESGLKVLQSQDNLIRYLKSITRKLIFLFLKETRLLIDLKKC